MKKVKFWLIIILGVVLLAPVGASAYTVEIADQTWVQGYYHGSPDPSYGWTDVVANDSDLWDISKVVVNWNTSENQIEMQIYTNYAPGGVTESGVNAGQADIALRLHSDDANAFWTYGISLAGINAGNTSIDSDLVQVASWYTSTDPEMGWSTGNWIYAGAYNPMYATSDPKSPIDVLIEEYNKILGEATVDYVSLGSGAYRIDILFPWIEGFDNFDFLIKSGTCANETMMGTATYEEFVPIPVPPSVMLLGTGLLGLGLLRWRRSQG